MTDHTFIKTAFPSICPGHVIVNPHLLCHALQ